MKRNKVSLLKETYATRISRLLWTKMLEYCIEHKVSLSSMIEDAVSQMLNVDMEKLLKEETQIAVDMGNDWKVWTNLLDEQRNLRKTYDDMQKEYKYKQKSNFLLGKVLKDYTIDDLIKLNEEKEDDK